jgi:prenylcysteine oxidase/farnesylcysteine lyase
MQELLQKFLLYYNGFESWLVFDNIEEMLKWSGLYGLTQRALEEEWAFWAGGMG